MTTDASIVQINQAALIGWTTTPWTLPSNMACCVNPELIYAKVRELQTNNVYILMESRIEYVFKSLDKVEILEKMPGKDLAGKKYEPLFDYFVSKYGSVAYVVLTDTYVTEESGTGVVHQAPYFGEDDYRVCLANRVISRDQEIVCPVDASGRFVEPVTDFVGQYVKDADRNIIALLKQKGRLVQSGQVSGISYTNHMEGSLRLKISEKL
jgi:isoleucyl-tRNA synthetase